MSLFEKSIFSKISKKNDFCRKYRKIDFFLIFNLLGRFLHQIYLKFCKDFESAVKIAIFMTFEKNQNFVKLANVSPRDQEESIFGFPPDKKTIKNQTK